MSETSYVQLISNDGFTSKVPLSIAMQSPILKNLLTNPAFSEFHSRTVNLPTISTPTLNKIVEYLYFKKRSIEQDRIDLINDFVIDPKEAVDLLQAADFLDI